MPSIKPAIFHAFTLKHNGCAHRIISEVSLTPAFDPQAHAGIPYPLHKTTGLWDTGATSSVVTAGVARAMNLVPAGRTVVRHAGGSSEHNTYVLNFFLPNRVAVYGVFVTECPDDAGDFGAIIGMDIIAGGDFSITNVNQRTVMSFRIPSIQMIDYVEQAHQITYAGVGRNDNCPCGKKDARGNPIKFKHCHGKPSNNPTT